MTTITGGGTGKARGGTGGTITGGRRVGVAGWAQQHHARAPDAEGQSRQEVQIVKGVRKLRKDLT